ncbi:MAG: DUF4177 domain-containing protein [Promethearchaeota archaeon]
MDNWEYHVVNVNTSTRYASREVFEARLNELGIEGWEAVTASFSIDSSSTQFWALLKRKLPE